MHAKDEKSSGAAGKLGPIPVTVVGDDAVSDEVVLVCDQNHGHGTPIGSRRPSVDRLDAGTGELERRLVGDGEQHDERVDRSHVDHHLQW